MKDDASLRDFNGGIGCHVASTVEEALLLPKDMTELQSIRKNEVFLNCKRYLAWYNVNLFFLLTLIIYRHILFVGYDINHFLLGCPSHFQA